jgi:hypothetical protein
MQSMVAGVCIDICLREESELSRLHGYPNFCPHLSTSSRTTSCITSCIRNHMRKYIHVVSQATPPTFGAYRDRVQVVWPTAECTRTTIPSYRPYLCCCV